MKTLLLPVLWTAAVAPTMFGSAQTAAAPVTAPASPFVFNWLPRSLVLRPKLDVSVLTEFTPRGRQLREVTAEKPMRYLAINGGYHGWGLNVPTEYVPTSATFERLMAKTLSDRGYVAADPAHPAALAIFYQWGSHYHPMIGTGQTDDELPSTDPAYGDRIAFDRLEFASQLVERAALLGGEEFARDFATALSDADDPTFRALSRGENPPMGSTLSVLFARHPRGQFLLDSVSDSLFFLVVSAYNAAELVNGRKELLWRTKIAVNASGLSLVETMPQLALAGAPYVGRETGPGVNIPRVLNRRERIEYGDLILVGWGESEASGKAGTERAGPSNRDEPVRRAQP